MSKVFCSLAMSLDGYIAVESGDLSWINEAMSPSEDYGFAVTLKKTGAYIMGTNTYLEMLKLGPAAEEDARIPTYVVTHRSIMEKSGEHISFYTGDLPALVKKIKTETEKDIYLFGGGNLLTQFIDLNLLDELEIGVIPVLLGDGVHCFGKRTEWKKLKLFNHKKYDTGIMILNYRFEKP